MYFFLSSNPFAELGQWNYDFSDPNGGQMGRVALPGMTFVYETEDPVILVVNHFELWVQLPEQLPEQRRRR